MIEYIDHTSGLLVQLSDFEKKYVNPYVQQKNRILEEGGIVGEKIGGHVSELTGLVHMVRTHVELTSVREVLILTLKEELEKQKVLRGGKLKLMMKDQMETILPIIEQLITTDR